MEHIYNGLIGDNLNSLNESSKMVDGQSRFKFLSNDVVVEYYTINQEQTAKYLKLAVGSYVLITLPQIQLQSDKIINQYLQVLTRELKKFVTKKYKSVLVVGYGNRHLVADSLGVKVVGGVVVGNNVFAIAPSVFALTGIESSDIVNAVCQKIKPQLVIVVDSLCANTIDRLGCSFQLTNYAFTPGSGVDNSRVKLKCDCDVISIGVPLVVYSNTFVKNAIGKNKNCKLKLDNINNLVVTLSDIDIVVDKCAMLISGAINKVFNHEKT